MNRNIDYPKSLQHTSQKTKDRPTRTSLQAGVNSASPEEYTVSAPHVALTPLLLKLCPCQLEYNCGFVKH